MPNIQNGLRGDLNGDAKGSGGDPLPRSKKYLSSSIVANRLNVSRRTIRLWAECGELPAIKIGRQWRFDADCLEAWISRQERPSGPQAGKTDVPSQCR